MTTHLQDVSVNLVASGTFQVCRQRDYDVGSVTSRERSSKHPQQSSTRVLKSRMVKLETCIACLQMMPELGRDVEWHSQARCAMGRGPSSRYESLATVNVQSVHIPLCPHRHNQKTTNQVVWISDNGNKETVRPCKHGMVRPSATARVCSDVVLLLSLAV